MFAAVGHRRCRQERKRLRKHDASNPSTLTFNGETELRASTLVPYVSFRVTQPKLYEREKNSPGGSRSFPFVAVGAASAGGPDLRVAGAASAGCNRTPHRDRTCWWGFGSVHSRRPGGRASPFCAG